MLIKNLRSILKEIDFDPRDPLFKILIDDNTSVDYCLTKAMETLHHMRTVGLTPGDFIILIRLVIIGYHKYRSAKEKGGI